ncbi:MAG: hypothetical protein R2705_06000 [Ilumatobacteraceae bacterium]
MLPFFIDWGHTTRRSHSGRTRTGRLQAPPSGAAWVKRVLQAVGPLDLVRRQRRRARYRGPDRPRQR